MAEIIQDPSGGTLTVNDDGSTTHSFVPPPSTSSGPVTFVDNDGVARDVDPAQVAIAVKHGWKPITADEADFLSAKRAELKEAGEHPLEAGALAAIGEGLPGGRAIVSHLGGPSLERQGLLAQANPSATMVGGGIGTVGQIAGVTALTGGLGDVAEAGEAAKAASSLERFGHAGVIGGIQGLTGGMNEADLGNVAYNSEALAQDAGVGTLLGLGGESIFAAAENVVPKAVSAAKGALLKLEDSGIKLGGRISAAITHNPDVAEQFGKAAAEQIGGETLPFSKSAKLAAKQDLNEIAVDAAHNLNDTLDKMADLEESHNPLRQAENAKLSEAQDAIRRSPARDAETGRMLPQTGVPIAKKAVNDLIDQQLAPALQRGLGGWNTPQQAAIEALGPLRRAVKNAETVADVHSALTDFRRVIQKEMKYGRALGATGDEIGTAAKIQEHILSPVQDLLGRHDLETGVLTPQSIAAFGNGIAERNAVINKAYTEMSTARANLMKRLGFTDLGENGRPETNIKASKVLALIKGEGEAGAVPTNLTQKEAKDALDEFIAKANNYADTVGESAKTASQELPEAGSLRESIEKFQGTRADAQKLLEPTETQKLAEMTSRTGEGAGGLRGATRNNPGDIAGAVVGAAGHPLIGAAISGANRAYSAFKYPVETVQAYAAIRRAAGKAAGMIGTSVRSFMSSEGRAAAAGLLGHEASSLMDDQKRFEKISKHLTALDANPMAGVDILANNTAKIGQYAPQHGSGIATVALAAHQVLIAALPKNPAPSPLGPGHDKDWKPNGTQLHTFDQVYQAVTDPKTVHANLTKGTLTPDAWDAYKKVYPQQAQDTAQQALEYVARNNDQDLTIKQKLGLTMITGFPVSPEVTPEQIAFQQGLLGSPASPAAPPPSQAKPRVKGLDKLSFSNQTATSAQEHELERRTV